MQIEIQDSLRTWFASWSTTQLGLAFLFLLGGFVARWLIIGLLRCGLVPCLVALR